MERKTNRRTVIIIDREDVIVMKKNGQFEGNGIGRIASG